MKRYYSLFCFLFCINLCVHSQNIGVNGNGSNAHPSAILDVDDSPTNNKGVLIPRVALQGINIAAPIASPTVALLIYNTANANVGANAVSPGYYYWSGAAWQKFKTIPNTPVINWSINGNTGTLPGTNFVGNNDVNDLVYKTNNNERVRISNIGNIGIGATFPNSSAILELQSPNSGFLITRVDTASIASPALGLMTLRPQDSCLYLFNGNKWVDNGGVGKKCKCYCGSTYVANQTFTYTGVDQHLTIPASAKWVDMYCWGGGGYFAGGFTTAHFDLTVGGNPIAVAGNLLSIMAGDITHNTYYGCGLDTSKCLYGFGGYSKKCLNEGYSGAGLSGVFVGSTPILETDAARSLAIAGGSGTYYDNDCACAGSGVGTGGNEPSGGGMPTFRGVNGTDNGSGGGGGGYKGGVFIPSCIAPQANPARGGSGYYHPAAIFGGVEYTTPINSGSFLPPPGTNNCLYRYPSGYSAYFPIVSNYCNIGGYGLVVIEWGD